MDFWNSMSASDKLTLISVLVAVIALWMPVRQTILTKRIEAQREMFLRYHAIIRQINGDEKEADGRPFIEMQIAAVFELTLLTKYHAVSLRILKRRKRLLKSTTDEALRREIDLAIAKIERCMHCRFNVENGDR